jgi:hypothetical protein
LTLETARLASDVVGGEELKSGEDMGAGDAVEVRDRGVFLTGEGSVAGKSPCGCERVDTMMAMSNQGRVEGPIATRNTMVSRMQRIVMMQTMVKN